MKQTPIARAHWILWIGLATVAWLRPAAAQPPAALEIAELVFDAEERVGIPRPKGWKFTNRKSLPSNENEIVGYDIFTCDVVAPTLGEFELRISLLNGCRATPFRQAVYEKEGGFVRGAVDGKVLLETEPVPNSRFVIKGNADYANLIAHLPGSGRGLSVVYYIAADRLERARPALVAIAREVVVQLPLWPPRPEGVEWAHDRGVSLAFDHTVDKRSRRAMTELVRKVVKQFEKHHGKHGFGPKVPLEIYFSEDANLRRELLLRDKEVPASYGFPILHRVTSTVPTTTRQRGNLASEIVECLWNSVYPIHFTDWLRIGEQQIGWMHCRCGRPVPSVPAKAVESMRRVRQDLEQISTRKDIDFLDAGTWTAFFRIGPSKYRKSYKAMLAELRTTTDPRSVVDAFTQSMDNRKATAAARKAMNKLKGLE